MFENENVSIVVGVHIRCEPEEFSKLLTKYKIDFRNVKIRYPKFYYDKLTYYFFETNLTRKEVINYLKYNTEIAKQINEFGFYEGVE